MLSDIWVVWTRMDWRKSDPRQSIRAADLTWYHILLSISCELGTTAERCIAIWIFFIPKMKERDRWESSQVGVAEKKLTRNVGSNFILEMSCHVGLQRVPHRCRWWAKLAFRDGAPGIQLSLPPGTSCLQLVCCWCQEPRLLWSKGN